MTTPPLIIKIGGAGVDDPAAAPDLWRALAEAHSILHGHLILIHGGGRAVDQQLQRLGMPTQRRDGIRITPPDQVDQIAAILAGLVNKSLVGALLAHGVRAVGLCLGDGGTAAAATANLGFDAGRVGEITSGDPALLRLLMSADYLPVISSIAMDRAGGLLNINADDAAAGIARLTGARALVLLTDVPGILDADGSLIPALSADEVESLITRGTIHGGMIPKARAAVSAAATAGAPAIIASFKSPEHLVNLARGRHIGTKIAAPPPATPTPQAPAHTLR